ncbi:putative bifunctional diguanylate cyclase/phosphodiesterase [Pseudoalteromonas luteoviolacea]|uniref:putative bifunctional diguanylate cyclase/phosphodiesterase n=1 Tax=Pseudoalteromonas luteoviolacea TaxID=43657 RepID=UPI001154DABE|nr:EAL domain-containing protein [Pseudoalteromonas luteoviolacea]TQF71013.1 EAL domain-containing protein [Pseudoalteromonas luteoviolacea]
MWFLTVKLSAILLLVSCFNANAELQNYHIERLTDTSNQLSIDAVIDRKDQFSKINTKAKFHKGETVWVKVSSQASSEQLVAITSPIEGHVKLYRVVQGAVVNYELVSPVSGYTSAEQSILPHQSIIENGKYSEVYIQVYAKYNGILSLSIMSPEEYRNVLNKRLFILGASSGVHYFIAFFVFLMAIGQSRKGLGALGAYFVCISLQSGVYNGANMLLFPSELISYFATFHSQIFLLSLIFAIIFLYFFMIEKRADNRYTKLATASIWFIAALAVLIAPLNAQNSLVFHAIASLICCALYAVVLKSQYTEHKDEVLVLALTWLPIFVLKASIFVNQFGFFWPVDESLLSHLLITLHVVMLACYLYWHDKNKKRRLMFYATHDKDTGAPNSYMLQQSLEALDKANKPHTLLLFRPLVLQTIRLNMGWNYANSHLRKLLSKVGKQLDTYGNVVIVEDIKSHTSIYRLDDSLFAVVLIGKFELSQIEQFVCVLSASFEEGIDFGGDLLVDQLEIGVASNPIHASSADSIIQCAMQAMAAKPVGTNKWQLFDFGNSIVSQRRIKIASALKVAIEREQLSLYLQPQLHLKSGRVYGAEALLRWHHPELGIIPPSEFIPIAESSGIIYELTEWVIERGLKQQADLVKLLPSHHLSLNISGRDVGRKELTVQLIELINQYKLLPGQLVLEVTESATVENETTLCDSLADYRSIGIKVAIDDFGTGYSSLAYLSQLGFDKLKVDKRFVMDLESSKTNQTICKATCDMAHSLGSVVVAEGVESEGSYRQLQSFECDIGQGYFISRPLPFDDYKLWLQRMTQVEDVIHYLTS